VSVEENLKLIDRRVAAFNAHDLDRFVGLHANSVIAKVPNSPEPFKGRAAFREFVKGFYTAFPDLQLQKVRAFGQDDWVCGEFILIGTNKGPMPGPGGQMIPPTNKAMRLGDCTVFKIEGGEITELDAYWDLLGMMAHLGLMK